MAFKKANYRFVKLNIQDKKYRELTKNNLKNHRKKKQTIGHQHRERLQIENSQKKRHKQLVNITKVILKNKEMQIKMHSDLKYLTLASILK